MSQESFFRSDHHPGWALRLPLGMQFPVWARLLIRYQFRLSINRVPTALMVTVFSVVNSVMAALQQLLFGRRIAKIALADDPIFIIGHWRSGTTLLHELLALDPRFVWPTTFECLGPSHFLLTRVLAPVLRHFVPERRPMDRMPAGLDRPQEDELALLILGLGSPYEAILFPNNRSSPWKFLDLLQLTEPERRRWKAGLKRFLQSVQLRQQRDKRQSRGGAAPPRFVLKSPSHTARLPVLLEMFPRACFIHLVREPEAMFASTVRLWATLFQVYGCHNPRFDALSGGVPSLEDYVLDGLPAVFRDFDRSLCDLPANRFCQVRFEELTRDPLCEIERIYETLDLEGFAEVRARLREYISGIDYTASPHSLPAEWRDAVNTRWREYRERYGY